MINIKIDEMTSAHPLYTQIKNYFDTKTVFGSVVVDVWAERGACIATAQDGETLVGFSINFCVNNHGNLTKNNEFMSFIQKNNLDMAKMVTACVYLDDEYLGQGLADKMTLARSQHSLEHGYTHQVSFGFETPEIFAYTQSIGGNVDTGAIDDYGYTIYVRAIQDGIQSMVDKGVTYLTNP